MRLQRMVSVCLIFVALYAAAAAPAYADGGGLLGSISTIAQQILDFIGSLWSMVSTSFTALWDRLQIVLQWIVGLGKLVRSGAEWCQAATFFAWDCAKLAPEYALWQSMGGLIKYLHESISLIVGYLPSWTPADALVQVGTNTFFRYANALLPIDQVIIILDLYIATIISYLTIGLVARWLKLTR